MVKANSLECSHNFLSENISTIFFFLFYINELFLFNYYIYIQNLKDKLLCFNTNFLQNTYQKANILKLTFLKI